MDRVRIGGALLCFACAGGLSAWGFSRPAPTEASVGNAPAITVQVGEQPVPAGTDARTFAVAYAEAWSREPLTLRMPEREPDQRSRVAWGAHLDVDRLVRRIEAARDGQSAMRRIFRESGVAGPLSIPLPLAFDEVAAIERLADLKDDFDHRAVSARVNVRTGEILAHAEGRQLDVHSTIDAIRAAIDAGAHEVDAVVTVQAPARTTDQLDGLDIGAVVGSFETRYASTEDSRDRSFNLGVAAAKIDGTVILPGETFDFNEVVGERSEANGFRPAPVIAGGELVDGVGGGTCQVAGTLHAAVFFAGLPVVERSPHSRPSTYIFMGLDAVVSYPQLNMRFVNDLAFPIAIGFTVEAGLVRAEIRAARTDRMVTFVRRVEEITPYDERDIEDASLPRGVRILRQRGVPGFSIKTFRIVRDTISNQARRFHGEDTYPPTQQIWRVGAGGEPEDDYVPPEGDTHAEYTADEYLTVSQGFGIAGQQVIRRAGRSGTAGWTERMGMPQPLATPPAP